MIEKRLVWKVRNNSPNAPKKNWTCFVQSWGGSDWSTNQLGGIFCKHVSVTFMAKTLKNTRSCMCEASLMSLSFTLFAPSCFHVGPQLRGSRMPLQSVEDAPRNDLCRLSRPHIWVFQKLRKQLSKHVKFYIRSLLGRIIQPSFGPMYVHIYV